jgi:hypothetical protein
MGVQYSIFIDLLNKLKRNVRNNKWLKIKTIIFFNKKLNKKKIYIIFIKVTHFMG